MKSLVFLGSFVFAFATVNFLGDDDRCIQLQQQFDSVSSSAEDTYAVASCKAKAAEQQLAFTYLALAIDKGFYNADWLIADANWDELSQDKRWMPLVHRVEQAQFNYLADAYGKQIQSQGHNTQSK